ncbi:Branchpoint-bridging protein [Apiospora arundinis]
MATLSNGRLTRWDSEGMPPRLPHLTTAVTGPMTSEQVDAYARLVRIEELHQMLLTDTVLPANAFRRCPSPPPQYDSSGVRTNTRQRRYRAALEDEYHGLVQRAVQTLTGYRPPRGYITRPARASKVTDKVYIPTKEFPGVNFIGQLLGPRGRSLADMSTHSSANIVIRGKGRPSGPRSTPQPPPTLPPRRRGQEPMDTNDPNEPLHCLITADTKDKVDRARELVQDVIERAATTPEHANARKRQQLRDLAVANGTFRDDEARGVDGAAGRLLTLPTDGASATTTNSTTAPASIPPWRKLAGSRGTGSQDSSQAPSALDLAYWQFEAEMEGFTNSY